MEAVSTPPSKSLSISTDPVESVTKFLLSLSGKCHLVRGGIKNHTPQAQEFHAFFLLSIFQCIGSTLEFHRNHTLDDLLQLGDFGFRDALDIGKLSTCRVGNLKDVQKVFLDRAGNEGAFSSKPQTYRFDRVISRHLQFLNIICRNPVLLQDLNALELNGQLV